MLNIMPRKARPRNNAPLGRKSSPPKGEEASGIHSPRSGGGLGAEPPFEGVFI